MRWSSSGAYFARTIGLLERLAQVPIAQKTVLRVPHEKLVEVCWAC